MPEDINSRIVISAESREAEQSIRNVTGELQNAIAAREKYLQLLKESAQYSEKTTTPPVQTVNFDPEGKMADNINRLSGIASHVISRLENIADKLNIVSQNIEGVTSRIRTMDSNVSVIPDKAETATESLKNVGNISFDNTLTGLDKIKVNLDEITDARTKELQIAKAQVNFELAEHKSMIAAQKAYNAELQMGSLEKLKAIYARKGDIEGVDKLSAAIERNRGKLLELKSEEASANLTAYRSKKILDNLSQATDGAANSTDKLTKRKAALRTASRLLHMDLGSGNAEMLKAGIIAAGAAAAVKILNHMYERSRKLLHDNAELAQQNAESQHEVTQRIEQRIGKEREALSVVSELSNKENRSVEETVRLAEAVRILGGDFEKLAEKIDIANGGIGDFSKISDELALKQIRRQRMTLKAEYNSYSGSLAEQREIRDTAGFSKWFLPLSALMSDEDFRIGGKAETEAANKKIAEFQAKQLEIQKKLYELRKQEENLIKNREVKAKAQAAADENAYADAQEALEDRTGNLNKQREIQELTNKGLLREAELLRINMKLDQERTKLSGQALTAFDEQRQNLLEAEMALFDTRSAGKQKGKRGENLLASMAKEFSKYRSTTQGAISANSVEGMRLQSRIFTNTSTDPAKQSADHLKKIEDQNKTIVNAVQTLSRLLTGISGNGLKLAGVSTKRY